MTPGVAGSFREAPFASAGESGLSVGGAAPEGSRGGESGGGKSSVSCGLTGRMHGDCEREEGKEEETGREIEVG